MHELVAEVFGAVEVADVDFEKSFQGFVRAAELGLPFIKEVEVVVKELK